MLINLCCLNLLSPSCIQDPGAEVGRDRATCRSYLYTVHMLLQLPLGPSFHEGGCGGALLVSSVLFSFVDPSRWGWAIALWEHLSYLNSPTLLSCRETQTEALLQTLHASHFFLFLFWITQQSTHHSLLMHTCNHH